MSPINLPTFLKLPLLLCEAVCMRINATPPNAPLPREGIIIPDWREKFLRGLGLPCRIFRLLSWSAMFIEFIVIVAMYNPEGAISRLILATLASSDKCVSNIRITPLLILGNILTISGTSLRVRCYRTLGRFFTFELRIQSRHQLIKEGPYSVVRHPSYTALILTVLGAFTSHASGSWIVNCGLLKTPIGVSLAMIWVGVALAVIASLLLRIPREDDLLRKSFGIEWNLWARKVPYCLVPGIY
ncbi:hypothetical protein Moror_1653 [Moniliophthora roreri MCA 2997]|uniref:Protein-S-isoprenylcysteine O-methyltransferase n=2 Tax=Moniliophthora roreri TaxID=221103 RepID=V2XKY3_MONRO|nr:hypothetical protein Moror_1653 [Moniliophthora roreri MCA 2997]